MIMSKILPGSERKPVAAESLVLDKNEDITITLQLRRRKPLPTPEQIAQNGFIAREVLEAEHGASEDDAAKVTQFAQRNGVSITDVDMRKRTIQLTGSAARMSELFQTELRTCRIGDRVCRVREGGLHLPDDLDQLVVGVFGLDTRPQCRPHMRVATAAIVPPFKPKAFDGVQLAAVYDFPSATGTGQTIALLELGGGFNQGDIDSFFQSLDLPPPKVSATGVDGAANSPVPFQDANLEVALDIEVAGAAAPGASIEVYFAPNTDQGFLDGVLAAIHDSTNSPGILSISWGAAESEWTAQAMTALDDAFQSAVAIGMSVFVAAGDDGANDNVSDGSAHVDFPASSPNVTACGGTNLVVDGSSRTEVAWNSSGDGSTGGGISNVFARPTYQQNLSAPANLSGKLQGRALPDVAACADPSTGYAVLCDGLWNVVGGTSAVAPLYAGLLARINQIRGEHSGLINIHLYSAGAAAGFFDIVSGNNSCDGITGYQCGPGWDAATGWGSPGGESLLRLLQ